MSRFDIPIKSGYFAAGLSTIGLVVILTFPMFYEREEIYTYDYSTQLMVHFGSAHILLLAGILLGIYSLIKKEAPTGGIIAVCLSVGYYVYWIGGAILLGIS